LACAPALNHNYGGSTIHGSDKRTSTSDVTHNGQSQTTVGGDLLGKQSQLALGGVDTMMDNIISIKQV